MSSKKKQFIPDNQINLFEEKNPDVVLTEEQGNFIFYDGKESIILNATAGSGKTFCIQKKLVQLLDKYKPEEITCFSYTKAAVTELQNRLAKETFDAQKIKIQTIHSFCASVLHQLNKGKNIVSFIDFVIWYKKNKRPSGTGLGQEDFLAFEELIDNMYTESQQYESQIGAFKLQTATGTKCKLPDFWEEYQEFLKDTKSRDFSDMLIEVHNLFKNDRILSRFKGRYKLVIVDEYQDTSALMMLIVLALNPQKIYLVGDKNQSLYSFSGANCDMIQSLLKSRREVVDMQISKNFRSDISIIENSNRHSDLKATPNSELQGYIHEKILFSLDQIIDIMRSENEVAVLVRTNAVIKKMEYELLKRKIQIKYFNYITDRDIEDYRSGKLNQNSKLKFERLLSVYGSIQNLISFIQENQKSKRFVTSIHKSKGLEFDTVIAVNSIDPDLLEAHKLLDRLSKKQLERISFDPLDPEQQEQKNIHYVAVSRPKHKLYFAIYDY